MFDLVIRRGTVVTASDQMQADIGIRDGIVAAIGRDLEAGAQEIDATGLLVLPGGVDSHVHCEQRGNAEGPGLENFATASRSAACGGTTSFISFARQQKGEGISESVEDYRKRAAKSHIDYSFHMTITDPSEQVLREELPRLIAEGHRSIKIFMTTHRSRVDDREILELLSFARAHGALVVVHAENYAATNFMGEATKDMSTSPAVLAALSKPPVVEREAVHRIVSFAEMLDATIQIFHVTCAEALEEIDRAQRRGVKVFAETCPQYLVLSEEDCHRPGDDALRFIFGPPPRTAADQEALWDAIRRGVIGIVSSDHAPHNLAGERGKRKIAATRPAEEVPHGIPGIETRLPLVFHEGVTRGRIDVSRFVAITATNPAKLFGLYPQKGTIAIGSDADIAIWDPDLSRVITNQSLHHAVDYTPYEGRLTTGWPVVTIARGSVIWKEGEFSASEGQGRWLGRNEYAFPLCPVH